MPSHDNHPRSPSRNVAACGKQQSLVNARYGRWPTNLFCTQFLVASLSRLFPAPLRSPTQFRDILQHATTMRKDWGVKVKAS